MKLRTRRKPAQEAADSQLSSEETLELDGQNGHDGAENGPVEMAASGDLPEATLEAPAQVTPDAAVMDTSPATNGASVTDGAASEGASATNGSGNGHTKGNGSGAIMLPKRRRRMEPASPIATAPAASVDVEEPPARVALPPRRRKAPMIVAETVEPEAEVAPVAGPPPVRERRPSLFSGERGLRIFLTYENLFWAGLFILTIATRFWDLAPRGIHHDESLHAHFSRQLYDGTGYIHDPMMHGPLQFHMIAMMYWLFGTTDATARFASVLCGIFVVMSPFFLRRQMGQVPAMVCAALLFISPSILYFSRMAREDAIFSGMEMIMLVGLWRFVSERKPTDFVIFMAGLALMFTIKETAYLTLVILAGVGLVLFALQAGYAVLAALGGYGIGMGVLYYIVNSGMKSGSVPQLPNIPQVSPNFDIIWQFMGSFFTHPLVLGALVLTALFVGAVSMMLATQRRAAAQPPASTGVPVRRHSASGVTVRRANGSSSSSASENGPQVAASTATDEALDEPINPDLTDDATPLYDPDALRPDRGSALGRYQPGSVPHLIGSLFAKPAGYRPLTPNQMLIGAGSIIAVCIALYGLASFSDQTLGFTTRLLVALFVGVAISGLVWLFMRFRTLMTGVLVFSGIYLTLYTVFFTDIPRGIISGPFGSLGYWMAQHDVVRGDQPWYFYLLLIPLYEPVAVFFSLAAIIFFAWRGGRWLADRMGDRRYGVAESRLGLFNTDRPVPFASFRAFFPLFLIAWLIGTVSIYSWAGEKMPWLMMHMVRPAIFLASLFVGALIVSLVRRRRERIAEAGEYDYSYGYEPDEPIQPRPSLPTRRHAPAVQSRQTSSGPMSALRGAFTGGTSLALAGASASGDGTPPQTVAMSSGYARRASRPAVPPRRRTQTREPEPEYLIEQDPPWVAWNRPSSLFPFVSYLLMFVILTMAWGLKMNALTYFESGTNYASWGLTWVFPLIILLATIGYAVWVGPGRALRYLAVGILAVGLMYEFRSSINLSYNNPDVPTEMATYVQTSPHVVSTIRNLDKFADARGATIAYPGGVQQGPKKNIKVMYDSFTSWPMEWYLRDFDKQFIGASEATPGADVPVLLLEYAKHNSKENLTRDYQVIRYPMRWWFPEEWYKEQFISNRWARDAQGNTVTDPTTGKRKESPALEQLGGALGTIRATLTEPPLQATLWKYLTFRETPMALGSEDMLLFVRKDVAQTWHRIQYEPPHPSTDVLLRALPEREWWLTDPKTGR